MSQSTASRSQHVSPDCPLSLGCLPFIRLASHPFWVPTPVRAVTPMWGHVQGHCWLSCHGSAPASGMLNCSWGSRYGDAGDAAGIGRWDFPHTVSCPASLLPPCFGQRLWQLPRGWPSRYWTWLPRSYVHSRVLQGCRCPHRVIGRDGGRQLGTGKLSASEGEVNGAMAPRSSLLRTWVAEGCYCTWPACTDRAG